MTQKPIKTLELKAKEWLSSLPWWKRIFTRINYSELHDKIIVTRDSNKEIYCIDTWFQQQEILQYIMGTEDTESALSYFNIKNSRNLDKANSIGGKRAQLRIFKIGMSYNDPENP